MGYGIKKLQIGCVVEDDKVGKKKSKMAKTKTKILCYVLTFLNFSFLFIYNIQVGTDILEEKITAFEDFVQSMDVAAFNKI